MTFGTVVVERVKRDHTEPCEAPMGGNSGGDRAVLAASAGSEVVLYGLSDLVAQAESNHRGATGLLRDLLMANSMRNRERIIRLRLDEIGVEWMAYETVSSGPSGGRGHRRACLSTYANIDWIKRYFEQSYHEVDPRHEQTKRSSLPLVWDRGWMENALADRAESARTRSFTQEFQDTGMGSGVFVRVPSRDNPAGDQAIICLGTTISNRRWIDDKVLGEALVLGLSLHEYMSNHVQFPAVECVPDGSKLQSSGLSAKQQTVLHHVAGGLTDRAIANELGVSPHTVDYYLRQLRQHFAVRNRVQLISAAAHLLG